MSHLYREWREVLREYIEQQEQVERAPIEFTKPSTPMEYREILQNLTENDYDK
jgi:hypothetical protein